MNQQGNIANAPARGGRGRGAQGAANTGGRGSGPPQSFKAEKAVLDKAREKALDTFFNPDTILNGTIFAEISAKLSSVGVPADIQFTMQGGVIRVLSIDGTDVLAQQNEKRARDGRAHVNLQVLRHYAGNNADVLLLQRLVTPEGFRRYQKSKMDKLGIRFTNFAVAGLNLEADVPSWCPTIEGHRAAERARLAALPLAVAPVAAAIAPMGNPIAPAIVAPPVVQNPAVAGAPIAQIPAVQAAAAPNVGAATTI